MLMSFSLMNNLFIWRRTSLKLQRLIFLFVLFRQSRRVLYFISTVMHVITYLTSASSNVYSVILKPLRRWLYHMITMYSYVSSISRRFFFSQRHCVFNRMMSAIYHFIEFRTLIPKKGLSDRPSVQWNARTKRGTPHMKFL